MSDNPCEELSRIAVEEVCRRQAELSPPSRQQTHALTMPDILPETGRRLLTKDNCAIAFSDHRPRSVGIGSIMRAADINITHAAWRRC
jgi:hypothetical protein